MRCGSMGVPLASASVAVLAKADFTLAIHASIAACDGPAGGGFGAVVCARGIVTSASLTLIEAERFASIGQCPEPRLPSFTVELTMAKVFSFTARYCGGWMSSRA